MSTVKATKLGPVAIRQRVKAGSNFSGVAPIDTATPLLPTFEEGIYKFAAGTDAGMFSFWGGLYNFSETDALYLLSIELILDSGTNWKLYAADHDGYAIEIKSGTGTYFCGMNATPLPYPILPLGTISLVTTGATAAATAKLKVSHFVP